MSKHPQNRLRRLVIVGPADKKMQPRSSGPRSWGPQRPEIVPAKQERENTRTQFRSLRMAVMPTLSRGMWWVALAWILDIFPRPLPPPPGHKESHTRVLFLLAACG